MSRTWTVVTLPLTPEHWARLGFYDRLTPSEFDRLLELLDKMKPGLVTRTRVVGAGAFPQDSATAEATKEGKS